MARPPSATGLLGNFVGDYVTDSKGKHRYLLARRLGSGAYGDVYEGYDQMDPSPDRQKYAIKVEPIKSERPQLVIEYDRYKQLTEANRAGFPHVYQFNRLHRNREHHALVIDLLGDSLLGLYNKRGKRPFSEPTVMQIALQTIGRMKALHEEGILHRDVKPDNFLIGLKEQSEDGIIYLVDMGYAKSWRNEAGQHISRESKDIALGTMRYMAIDPNKGLTHGRKDDLEALGYMFAWCLRGTLPWSRLPPTADMVEPKVRAAEHPETALFPGCDSVFAAYFRAVRKLKFENEPKYDSYIELFQRKLFLKYSKNANVYDWTTGR